MSKNTGTSELINYFDLGVNGDVGIAGSLDINTIANATTDTDTFLVSDTGIIKYRTGAQLLSDIGAAPATGGSYLPLAGGTLTGTLIGTTSIFGSPLSVNQTSKIGIGFESGYGRINSWGADPSTYGGLSFEISHSNGDTYQAFRINPTGDVYIPSGGYFGLVDAASLRVSYATGFSQALTPLNSKFVNSANNFVKIGLGQGETYPNFNPYYGIIGLDNSTTLANNKLRFYIGYGDTVTPEHSNDQLVIQGDGNVGIGTATPSAKLHVIGTATFSSLSGTGTRMVVTDANGLLSTQAIGSGAVTGTGTTNYLPKFTGSTTIGNSLIFDNGTNVLIGTTTTPTPVAGVSFPFSVTSAAATRIRIDSTQATPNSGFGLYANSVQKWSIAMFGTDSDFTIYNDALLSSAILVKGITSNVLIGYGVATGDTGFKLDVNGTGRFTGAATFSSTLLTGGDITVSKSGDSGINLNSTTTNGVAVTRYATTAAGNLWATGINITNSDSRWEVYNFALGVSPFRLSTTGAATFSSSVQVGSGTYSSGLAKLYTDSTYGTILTGKSGSASDMLFTDRSGNIALQIIANSSTPNVVINGGGNVLIGTTTDAGYKLNINSATTGLNVGNQNNSVKALATFNKTLTTGFGTANNYLQLGAGENGLNGTRLIGFGYSITANTNQPAYIGYIETSNSGETNGSLIFGTRSVTTDTEPTERMRITSGGYLKASNNGVYNDSTGTYHEMKQTGTSQNIVVFRNQGTDPYGLDVGYPSSSPNNTVNNFIYCFDSTAQRFSVRSNGGIANFQANDVNLSDERTKKDIIPLESYWDKFKAIEIVKFKYKDQTHDDFNIGVIAQQVEAVAPEFVDVDGWGETPENEQPLKSIYTSDLHHATIKVLQEAMAKIEELQVQIDKLKNS